VSDYDAIVFGGGGWHAILGRFARRPIPGNPARSLWRLRRTWQELTAHRGAC